METDDAGLELVDYIRTQLKNETVRIILRTGQPGQAPERRVIVDYDINDYKAKTELTADKLFTALTAALRSYQQLQRMVETRRGLEMIIEGASTLYDFKSMQLLAEGVLTQIASLLNVDCGGILVLREGGAPQEKFSVLAGSGCYSHLQPERVGAASLDTVAAEAVPGAFAAPLPRIPSEALGALHPHRERARGGGGGGDDATADRTPTARWSRCSAAACRSPSTTSSSTSNCTRRMSAWRSACASARARSPPPMSG